ncbi:MAG TPA: hypothetical protein VJV22_05865, partial [Acidobacteriaceae bacterium]|nr:hypothetical protein [Acidobacteriaceae bacterium]
AAHMADIVEEYGLDIGRFIVELTESAWMLDADRTLSMLETLRDAGVVTAFVRMHPLLPAPLPLLIAGARRKRWPVQLYALVLLLAVGSLLGCGTSGGGSSSTTTTRNPGTPRPDKE